MRGNRYNGGMSEQEQMKKVMAYLIGYRLGSQVLPQMLPGLSSADLEGDLLSRGVMDGLDGDMDMGIVNEKVNQYQHDFMVMLQERGRKSGEENLARGREFMQENARRPGVVTTGSGLQYEVLVPGGAEKYSVEQYGEAPTAEVMYKGTLVDGTVFDQSAKPVKFNIRQVIPGFTEALKLMPVGAKWRVVIPAQLAYGEHGPGSIGPNSTLIFEMELLGLSR